MSWYNKMIGPVVSFYNNCKPATNPRLYTQEVNTDQSASGDSNAMRKQSKRTSKKIRDENFKKSTTMESTTSSNTTERPRRIQSFALSRTHDTTDVPVGYLFLFLVLLWIFSGIFVIYKGEITKFLVPRDSKGRYCSEHKEVLDKPNMFFFDTPNTYEEFLFGRNTTQICVKQCPSENFNFNQHVSEDNWNLTKFKMLCSNYILPDTYKEAKSLVEKKQCASAYVASNQVKNRCFPQNSTVSADLTWFDLWINNFMEVIISSETVKQFVVHLAEDIEQTYPMIIRSVYYGLVVTFVYIALLRWIAGYLVWSTMFLTAIILGAFIINTYIQYEYYSAFPDSKVQLNFLRPDSLINYFTTNTTIYFIVFVVLLILLIALICTIMFLQEQIKISIALIKESSKAVTSAFPILALPVIPLLCQIVCIIFAGTVYTCLTSISIFNYQIKIYSNNATSCLCDNVLYKDQSSCNPRLFKELCEFSSTCSIARCEQDTSAVNWYIEPLKWLNFIMFLWTFFFISDAKKMVLAFVFSTWYWSFDKSKMICKLHRSIYYTFRYHLGTIALGSLIITIFKLIKYLFTKLYNKFDKLDNNYKKTAKICCNVLFIIFEKFLRILSENAYIMCAIYGKNFMYSAKKSFFLLLKNPLRYYVLNKSIFLLFMLARVVISCLVAGLVYIAFHTVHKDVKLTHKWTPVITVALLTFFVSKILFAIYEMAVYTIFICFCEDCEINDGSAERPYYMANKLQNILPKNKDDDSELLNMAVQRTSV